MFIEKFCDFEYVISTNINMLQKHSLPIPQNNVYNTLSLNLAKIAYTYRVI